MNKLIFSLKHKTHQIDEDLPAIIEDLRVKMSWESLCMVLVLDQVWLRFILEVRKLIPEERYWPTSLENNINKMKINFCSFYELMCHITYNVHAFSYMCITRNMSSSQWTNLQWRHILSDFVKQSDLTMSDKMLPLIRGFYDANRGLNHTWQNLSLSLKQAYIWAISNSWTSNSKHSFHYSLSSQSWQQYKK